MRRRSFLRATGSAAVAAAASTTSGCLGGNGPSEQEWETVRDFVREGTDLLERARSDFVSWREDPDAVSADAFATLADDLDDVGTGPLPPREEVQSWEFDVSNEDETWRVQGEELDQMLADLASTMTDAQEASRAISDAGADPDSVGDDVSSEVDRLVEEIPGVVDDARGLLFGV